MAIGALAIGRSSRVLCTLWNETVVLDSMTKVWTGGGRTSSQSIYHSINQTWSSNYLINFILAACERSKMMIGKYPLLSANLSTFFKVSRLLSNITQEGNDPFVTIIKPIDGIGDFDISAKLSNQLLRFS